MMNSRTGRGTKGILLSILSFYRYWLSPAVHTLSPWGCRYRPTCSQYAMEAIALHGAARGSWMALRRLLRCHPFARSGFDPVPLPVDHHTRQDGIDSLDQTDRGLAEGGTEAVRRPQRLSRPRPVTMEVSILERAHPFPRQRYKRQA